MVWVGGWIKDGKRARVKTNDRRRSGRCIGWAYQYYFFHPDVIHLQYLLNRPLY